MIPDAVISEFLMGSMFLIAESVCIGVLCAWTIRGVARLAWRGVEQLLTPRYCVKQLPPDEK